MKKFISKLLWIAVVITLFITTLSLSVLYLTNKNRNDIERKKEELDKGYKINSLNDGIIQAIAFSLIKPILEARIDFYIEKHGLLDYLKQIKRQKEFNDSVSFYDISHGDGKKAICGSRVSLQLYKLSNYDDILDKEQYLQGFIGFNNTISEYKIGEKKGLDWGIIGMKEGGERVISVNNTVDDEVYTGINDKRFYYVKLLSVKTKSPSSMDNLMIFDNADFIGSMPVMCGDEVKLNFSIRKHNGELFIDSQSVRFKVGDGKMPLAIELGVLKMQKGRKRTIISPIDLLTTTDDMIVGNNIKPDESNVVIITLDVLQDSNDLLKF